MKKTLFTYLILTIISLSNAFGQQTIKMEDTPSDIFINKTGLFEDYTITLLGNNLSEEDVYNIKIVDNDQNDIAFKNLEAKILRYASLFNPLTKGKNNRRLVLNEQINIRARQQYSNTLIIPKQLPGRYKIIFAFTVDGNILELELDRIISSPQSGSRRNLFARMVK